MDIYLTSLALGGVGLVAMAAGGIGRDGHGSHTHGSHGHGDSAGHGASGHGHHGAVGHGHDGHAAAHTHDAHHGDHGHAGHDAGHHAGARDTIASSLLSVMSPRVLFSVALGLGTCGLLLRGMVGGPTLFGLSFLGGILFERYVVTPVWNFTFRFASHPALTLESALMSEATAVTSFDRNGQGLVAIEVDGQLVQLLGTLQSSDQALRVRVQAGARLRVEDVDAARNRCSVSLL
jgi:hypothetical protein